MARGTAEAVRKFVSAGGYLCGTTLLIPGTFCFFPSFTDDYYSTGVWIYIVACSFLTLAAVVDVVNLFTLTWRDGPGPICMLLGGVLFLTASILYIPSFYQANTGTWVFRIGSCAYLCGSFVGLYNMYGPKSKAVILSEIDSLHDPKKRDSFGAINDNTTPKTRQKPCVNAGLVVICLFIVGAVMFIIGGVLSQLQMNGFAATWMIGSVCFCVGALISFVSQYALIETNN